MVMIEQIVTSFVAAATFGIIFNVPKQSILKCGAVGMIGWFVYTGMTMYGVDSVVSTLVATFFIAVTSQFISRAYKTPIIIFSVAGIIPLVPGGLAYDAMRNFVENDYNTAINLAAKAFMISGSIAIGLVLSEVLNQVVKKSKERTVTDS
ncbi:threonine/serine exporter family protein [Bacillus timonensis]|nr:threonine/serine exporter family protein [Bacillus timonensis]